MALRVPDPATLEQKVELLEADPSGETWVRIKQATTGEDAQLSALWAKSSLEWDDKKQGTVRQYNEVSRAQIMAESVRLTLLESNLEDSAGDPLFPPVSPKTTRDQAAFFEAWGQLPITWANEIYQAVLRVNPQWGRGNEEGEA